MTTSGTGKVRCRGMMVDLGEITSQDPGPEKGRRFIKMVFKTLR